MPVALVLVGLCGGDGKTDVTVQLHHGQAGNFTHGRVILLHPDDKIDIGSVHQVRYDVVALISTVKNDDRLTVKGVTLEHLNQCTWLVFLGGGLDNSVKKGTLVEVKKRVEV